MEFLVGVIIAVTVFAGTQSYCSKLNISVHKEQAEIRQKYKDNCLKKGGYVFEKQTGELGCISK